MNLNRASFHASKQRGLTLIELLVVLIIITGIAGIVLPIMPQVDRRTKGSTGGGNMREVVKAIEMHRGANGSYPDEWDSLIDSNDITAATLDIVTQAVGSGNGPAIVTALTAAGITTAYEHDDFTDDDVSQTFDGLTNTSGLVNELSTNVAILDQDGIDSLGLEDTGTGTEDTLAYVAFGLGRENTMIGDTIVDAPIRFFEGADNPINSYGRWIVVFAVPVDTNEPLRLASIAGIRNNALESVDAHIERFYQSL
ncbi:MAG: prepilin-type N-terminal cleavage/methylation domain-containing protein [Verrucomicrobiota bacterium]